MRKLITISIKAQLIIVKFKMLLTQIKLIIISLTSQPLTQTHYLISLCCLHSSAMRLIRVTIHRETIWTLTVASKPQLLISQTKAQIKELEWWVALIINSQVQAVRKDYILLRSAISSFLPFKMTNKAKMYRILAVETLSRTMYQDSHPLTCLKGELNLNNSNQLSALYFQDCMV